MDALALCLVSDKLKQMLSLSLREWHKLDQILFFPGTLMEKRIQINIFSFRENDTAMKRECE